MKKSRRVIASLIALAGLAFLGAAPAAASVHSDTSDFTFSSFVADYYLSRDPAGQSTLRTVEKLTAVFPNSNQNKGIVRDIPNEYRGKPLHTKLVSISDSNGVTKPYSVHEDSNIVEVNTGTDDYVHGSVTYTLTYTQINVVGEFTGTGDQEFYWDTNGTGWDQPFSSVTARVHIDPSLASALSGHNACYQGAQGSKDKCEIAGPPVPSSAATPTPSAVPSSAHDETLVGPATAVYTATASNLKPNENMSVVLGFADGTFSGAPAGTDEGIDGGVASGPPPADPAWAEAIGALMALLGLGGIPFALVRRFGFGQRDAKGRGTIIAQYDIPKNLNLLEAAALIGREASGVSAQIVSFAVRGKLRILDYPVTASGGKFTLELTTADGVDAEEGQLLAALFPALKPGDVREIVASDVLATQLTTLKATARQSLVAKGLKVHASARDGIRTGLILLGLLVAEFIYVVALGAANIASGFAVLAIPITFLAMIIAFATARRGDVLTDAGAEQRDYLKGMQLYLTIAEEDRMRMLQSPTGAERVDYGDNREVVKLYEKLLPFAVLWGVEDQWSKQLAIHYSQDGGQPDWFVSQNAFNSALFASSFAGLSSAVTTSVTPVSSSYSGGGSSFGGSFGGGFSGGGGGGGGGGGR